MVTLNQVGVVSHSHPAAATQLLSHFIKLSREMKISQKKITRCESLIKTELS